MESGELFPGETIKHLSKIRTLRSMITTKLKGSPSLIQETMKILVNNKQEAKIRETVEFPLTILTSHLKISKLLSQQSSVGLGKNRDRGLPQLLSENPNFRKTKKQKE